MAKLISTYSIEVRPPKHGLFRRIAEKLLSAELKSSGSWGGVCKIFVATNISAAASKRVQLDFAAVIGTFPVRRTSGKDVCPLPQPQPRPDGPH
jgi:hypothetical protein